MELFFTKKGKLLSNILIFLFLSNLAIADICEETKQFIDTHRTNEGVSYKESELKNINLTYLYHYNELCNATDKEIVKLEEFSIYDISINGTIPIPFTLKSSIPMNKAINIFKINLGDISVKWSNKLSYIFELEQSDIYSKNPNFNIIGIRLYIIWIILSIIAFIGLIFLFLKMIYKKSEIDVNVQ